MFQAHHMACSQIWGLEQAYRASTSMVRSAIICTVHGGMLSMYNLTRGESIE